MNKTKKNANLETDYKKAFLFELHKRQREIEGNDEILLHKMSISSGGKTLIYDNSKPKKVIKTNVKYIANKL